MKAVVRKDRLGIGTTHFEYDAFGRRIRKFNGSYASTDFRWGGMRLVRETYHDRQGEEALTYLYEANSYVPLARIDQGKPAANDADARDAVYYFHNDVSGLPEELTNADGELTWQARYKMWGSAVREDWIVRESQRPIPAWGEVQGTASGPSSVPRPQNLRFQGQYLDRETGLHYNLFRYYDPDVGRYISPDPIGLAGGVNLYQYANGNPISWIDPLGLFGCDPKARKHILYGDSPTSGGHMWPGNPGKTVFPESWDATKIISEVDGVVNSPNTKWYAQTGTGGALTKAGEPATWVSWEVRDGVRIRTVYQPAVGRIVTAFPDNEPIPILPEAK
ncbi:RHS repeat-associated core domain-containing protein [Burkholderia cepacia]|uniref:RHS repeat-associated core domain-containing protein n=2 Tax=Burkholderia cepacia TaxID=292 RepID=UPI00299E5A2E|nr:RHS repeat-associated core domain-containing protein [Burkholderia cepacia]